MDKPKVKFVGADGNVFNLMSLASKALKKAKQDHKPMLERVMKAGSYEEAISIMGEYCDIS